MLERHLNTFAKKLNLTRDAYGDFVHAGIDTVYRCRLRETSMLTKADQMESTNSNAMLWLPYYAVVSENDIFLIKGGYYKVLRVLQAIKLGGTSTQFIKCAVSHMSQVIS